MPAAASSSLPVAVEAAEFWKRLFLSFEEATPLAFGHGEKGRGGPGSWRMPVGEAGASPERLLAAWALLLARFSGDDAVTLGFQAEGADAVQPLRLHIDESLGAAAFLDSIGRQIDEQLGHPVDEAALREWIGCDAARPLFTSTVIESAEIRGEGVFSEATIARVRECLLNLLGALAAGGSEPVLALEHLPADARERLLHGWNREPVPYPEATVHALFERQAAARPGATALVLGPERLTYGELNARANRLAHALIAAGVRPGSRVAMLLERGFDPVIAALAILKAGAAYVPLDPALPPERIAQMAGDVEPPVVLVQPGAVIGGVPTVALDDLQAGLEMNPGLDMAPDAPAYVIFTSGSTGRPKGVEMPHRGVARLACTSDYIPLEPQTVLLHMASIAFDVSVYEIWGPLLNGGTCVVCPHKVPTIGQVRRLLAEHRVNTLLCPAAFFNLIVKEDPQALAPLKYLMVGGEALSPWHVERALKELPATVLMNGYGPTENAVNSTVHLFDRATFDPSAPIPIGRPIANSSCYILDRSMRPVPVGVPGELHVGGDGVARGYAGRPDLTAERFLDDPFSGRPGARMYRTGDMAYWNPDGSIGFIGRTDGQVKLRGFRVELQEIEMALAAHPAVEQAVVVLHEDAARGKWLAGYVKVEDPDRFSLDALRVFALERLPEYMVPAPLLAVREWRHTPNGKIDRKALPRPMPARAAEEVAYATATETALAEIWKELLGCESVPRDQGFFELGGDSLKAVSLFLKIHQRFGRDLTLATLLHAPTIAALAVEIEGRPDGGAPRALKRIRAGDPGLPPFFWFHGGDGHVLLFQRFAENFDTRQSIHAFQYAGLDGRAGEPTVEEMARSYVAELLEVCPKGPVRLGGYCIGGYVAIEVARLLEQTEVEVLDPLVVSGTPNVRAKSFHSREPEATRRSRAAFARMCDEMAGRKIVADAEIHRDYVPPASGWLKLTRPYAFARRLRTRLRLARMAKAARAGHAIPPPARGWYCGNSTAMAGERHRSRGYGGRVLYFRSGECHGSAMGFRGWWTSLFMGFEELCRGGFEGFVVGGLHEDVLKRPEVARIVKERFEAHG